MAVFAVLIAALLGPTRLALALPAMFVDGLGLQAALRRAVDATRGRVLANGAALFFGGLVLPTLAYGAVRSVARGAVARAGAAPRSDVVWAGAATVVEDLALVALVPVYATLLVAAYRAAVWTPGTAAPSERSLVSMRGWVVAALALLVAAPSAVASAIVAANPGRLVVATTSDVISWGMAQPYTMLVLDDGSVAIVDWSQVALCLDTACADDRTVPAPCIDGIEPSHDGQGAWSCSSEGPYAAADITPDGTLVALTRRGATGDQDVRMLWCGVVGVTGPRSTCDWGGATTLHAMPDMWENWSMAVAAIPSGGVEALLVGAGPDTQHGEILLVSCDRLECPQPTVRVAHTIDLPDEWFGAGVVDIDVDWASGALAMAYYDSNDGSLWLGGCPALCPDGPALTQTISLPSDHFAPPELVVVASPHGPAAVMSMHGPDVATVVACTDLACTNGIPIGQRWSSAWPVADHAGRVFIVGTAGDGPAPTLWDVRTGDTIELVGDGRILAAAFGPDDRLRVLLVDAGESTLVTCASPHCAGP